MRNDYAQLALKGVSIIIFVYFLNALVSYAFRLLMAKELTVAEYGLFYSLFSLLSLIYIIRDMGFNQALVKFIPEFLVHKDEGKVKTAILFMFGLEMLLSVIVTAGIFILAPWLANNYFHNPASINIIRLFSIAFFVFALDNILATVLQSFQKMTALALLQLFRTVALFIFTLVFFFMGFSLNAPIFGYLLVSGISAVILVPYIARKVFALHEIHGTRMGRESWKLIRYGIVVFISGIGGSLLQNIDTAMLTYYRGLTETGLYNAAVPTANIIAYFSGAVTTVAFPLFAELHASGLNDQVRKMFLLMYRFAFIGTIPIIMLFVAFPELIIRVLFGEAFVAASLALQILVIGIFLYVITQMNFSYFNASNRQSYPLIMLIACSVLNGVGNFFTIPKFGMTGAAIVSLICFALMFLVSVLIVRKCVGVELPWWFWFKSVCAGLIFLVCVMALKNWLVLPPILEAIVVTLVCMVIYIIVIFAAGLTSAEEIKWVARKILRRT